MKRAVTAGLAALATLAALAPAATATAAADAGAGGGHARFETVTESAVADLTGKTVVIDAGHQLGNHNYPAQINKLVTAGPFKKPCNTTGTSTASGYPEATFTFVVARKLKRLLQAQGATVVMVRRTNREDRWGPCVDARGRAGNAIGADAKISIHGDGNLAPGARGFHVIAPGALKGWTDDIAGPSSTLAGTIKNSMLAGGFPVANYIAGVTASTTAPTSAPSTSRTSRR